MKKNSREERNFYTLLCSIIGDAFATPFDGLGRQHLHAVFKTLEGYVDPSPALKGNMDRWKKPALYSSMSQMSCLLGLLLADIGTNTGIIDRLTAEIKKMPDNGENGYTIFRNPGSAERRFIQSARNHDDQESYHPPAPCARTLSMMIPLSLSDDTGIELEALGLVHSITRDPLTVAGALIFLFLLKQLHENPSQVGAADILIRAIVSVKDTEVMVKSMMNRVFEAGCNPDTLIQCISRFGSIFHELADINDKKAAENIICSAVSTHMPGPVTRATINHPLLILPYTLVLIREFSSRPLSLLNNIIVEGGSVSILTTLAGALAGSIWGREALNEALLLGLVNRHRIHQITELIAYHKHNGPSIDEYVTSELSLSRKENEEKKAKLKHVKKKTKKEKPRKRKEEELSRHIVESWTKIDKARWKKEKNKHNE